MNKQTLTIYILSVILFISCCVNVFLFSKLNKNIIESSESINALQDCNQNLEISINKTEKLRDVAISMCEWGNAEMMLNQFYNPLNIRQQMDCERIKLI